MRHLFIIPLILALCNCNISEPASATGTPPQGAAGDGTPAGDGAPSGTPGGAPGGAPAMDGVPASARLVPVPVDSVEDVPGSYVQPFALPGQVSTITLAQPAYGMGSYQLFRSCGVPTCVAEIGQYHMIPTNPAIGFAALSLADQTGSVRATYILDYLWRDDSGALVAIQLRALFGNGTGPTQVWWRLPGATTTPTGPVSRTMSSAIPTATSAIPTATSAIPTVASGAPDSAAAPAAAPAVAAAPAAPAAPVEGVYVRALPIYGDIGAITIDEAVWSGTIGRGTFQASYPYCLPWCIGENGDYALELALPSTGSGRLSLIPAGNPEATHDYVVYAIWRGPDGTPAAIQLQRVDGVAPSGPPFTLYREWWSGTGAYAVQTPVTCATWTSLAAYYRIRALQCGMGACWALAPYYSAWAQYYDALAAAQGCNPTP